MNTIYEYLKEVDVYYFACMVVGAYFLLLLVMAAWFYFKRGVDKRPLLECAECGPGGSTFLVPSLYDEKKMICPDCWDIERKKRPHSAGLLRNRLKNYPQSA